MYKRINKLLGTKYKSNKDINWSSILQFYKLSEDFIEEFKNVIDWKQLSFFQPLTEEFIRKYEDRVDWDYISISQVLTPEFMKEFIDRFNLCDLMLYQPFINKNIPRVKEKELNYNESYHLYQQTKERGWFIGTIYKSSLEGYEFSYPNRELEIDDKDVYLKARIYWKDLIKLDLVKKYEPIRLYKWIQ